MGLVKKIIATTACLATLLSPMTIEIKDADVQPLEEVVQTVSEEKSLSFPSIHIKKNTARARDYTLEGRITVLGFDVLFNGVRCGIGASSRGDDFWPAFGKCALLGLGVFGGKEIASWNGYDIPFAGGMGKGTHDFFVSMIDNEMQGNKLLSRFRTDFGPIEFDFNNGSVDLYVHPYSAYYLIKNIADGHRFELKDTLYNLTPVFSYDEKLSIPQGPLCGRASQNIIAYRRIDEKITGYPCSSLGKGNIMSHENNHVLFISEFRFLDDLMGKKSDVIKQIPIIRPLAPIFDHIKLGPLMAMGIFAIPGAIHPDAYWYTPTEMEAYTMERPFRGQHPFYR